MMEQLFSVVIFAVRDGKASLMVGAMYGDERDVIEAARERVFLEFPTDDGWSKHGVTAQEVSAELLCAALSGVPMEVE